MKFQYDVLDATYQYSSQLENHLNRVGKNGWELVNCEIRKEKSGYSEFIIVVGILKKRIVE